MIVDLDSNRLEDWVLEVYGDFWRYSPDKRSRRSYFLNKLLDPGGVNETLENIDIVNGQLDDQDASLIDYVLRGHRYPVYTVRDLNDLRGKAYVDDGYDIDRMRENIMGLINERIAWWIVSDLLDRHMSQHGGHLLNADANLNDIIRFSSRYALKKRDTTSYVLLEQVDDEVEARVKEIDGLFIYENAQKEKYLFVLETKTKDNKIGLDRLPEKLIDPLRDIFGQDTRIIYVQTSSVNSIHRSDGDRISNVLQSEPARIFRTLLNYRVGSTFVGYVERGKETDELVDHIITHAKLLDNQEVAMDALYTRGKRIRLPYGDCNLHDLVPDPDDSGIWYDQNVRQGPSG